MRQVNLLLTQEEFKTLAATLYAKGCANNALEEAVGYFSLWGLNFPVVNIFVRDMTTGELCACYRKHALDPVVETSQPPAYVMGAVFNDNTKKYNFHS